MPIYFWNTITYKWFR